jgi:hypothetical protein
LQLAISDVAIGEPSNQIAIRGDKNVRGGRAVVGALVLLAGIMAHTVGIFGAHRADRAAGYLPAALKTAAYWFCWVLIAGALPAAGSVLL